MPSSLTAGAVNAGAALPTAGGASVLLITGYSGLNRKTPPLSPWSGPARSSQQNHTTRPLFAGIELFHPGPPVQKAYSRK
jgi:hypothetical protein